MNIIYIKDTNTLVLFTNTDIQLGVHLRTNNAENNIRKCREKTKHLSEKFKQIFEISLFYDMLLLASKIHTLPIFIAIRITYSKRWTTEKCTTRTSSTKPTQHTTSTCQAMAMRHWPHCIQRETRHMVRMEVKKLLHLMDRETTTRGAGRHAILFYATKWIKILCECRYKLSKIFKLNNLGKWKCKKENL